MLPRFALGLFLAVVGTLALAGCGVRGSLEAPADEKTETGNAIPGRTGEAAPKKGFILDPLLR